jgi:hypothetical protein
MESSGPSGWIGYCSDSFGFRRSIKFICTCAFLCLSVAAQTQAALADLHQSVFR